MKNLLASTSIINRHIERAADGNDNLLTGAMSMTTTTLTRRHVVSPVDTGDVERNVLHLLSHRQVATRVDYLRQVYNSNLIHCLMFKLGVGVGA